MSLKRLWEEKIQWLLVVWCGFGLLFRPGWIPFGLGVILWFLLLYLTAPGTFWTLVAAFNFDQDKVQSYLRRAIAAQPASPKPYTTLALVTARKGAWEEAITLLAEANKKPGKALSPDLRNIWAICYRETGNYEEALSIIERLIQSGYVNEKVYFNLAYTHYKAGHLDEGLKAAEKARTYNISDPDPVLLIARINFDQQDYATAKDNYEWCLKHTSWPVETYYWLGRCELELGLIDQACDHLATAVERITDDPALSDVPREEAQAWLDKALALRTEREGEAETKKDAPDLTPQASVESDPNRS